MINLSFIIPFYNGEQTIFTMLDSIFAMGLQERELEIIVVDDCSPIIASDVLREYMAKRSNVRVIRHEINKRQGGAKNTGICAAQGKYIAFADQDDMICSGNMFAALKVALQYEVDMLCCHFNLQDESGGVDERGIVKGDGMLMTGKDFCEQYFMPGYNLAPWANLYRRDFLLNVFHPYEENVVMEDSDWIAWHWIHADKVGIFNKPIYTWVMNPLSITHSQSYINRADWIKFGYRKIRDAQLYEDLSPSFANEMQIDGRNNIIGGMKKIWKVDSYRKFYHHLGITLKELQKMRWNGIVNMLINYPNLSLLFLYPIGSMLKIFNYARYKFK